MTREEAIKANEIIDGQIKMLEPVWAAALAARDEAQNALNAIREMKRKAQEQQIANLRAVQG